MNKVLQTIHCITVFLLLAASAHAEEAATPLLTALKNTTIVGYVDASRQWNPGPGGPVLYSTYRIPIRNYGGLPGPTPNYRPIRNYGGHSSSLMPVAPGWDAIPKPVLRPPSVAPMPMPIRGGSVTVVIGGTPVVNWNGNGVYVSPPSFPPTYLDIRSSHLTPIGANFQAIPEPSTFAILGAAGVALLYWRRRLQPAQLDARLAPACFCGRQCYSPTCDRID